MFTPTPGACSERSGLKTERFTEFIREYSAREDCPKPPVVVKEAPVKRWFLPEMM
jgi:hypothetical protein